MPNIEEKPVDFRTWVGVLGTMLGAFMAVLDIQITNSSLRDITGGIAATQDERRTGCNNVRGSLTDQK
jgi:MFS transporter, DHA2 family, multidrug resistance protein